MYVDLQLERLSTLEGVLCQRMNHWNQRRLIGLLFATVSRLGDGILWYLIMGLLPFYGDTRLAVTMVLTGVAATTLYHWLKRGTRRLRPCEALDMPFQTVAPLDRFSFPSGHTLHAVCFTILLCHAHPLLGWLLVPMTSLIALSRLVLGLHYPSDVLMGAGIGAMFASVAISCS